MTLPLHYCTICLTVAKPVSFFRQYYFSMSSTSDADSLEIHDHITILIPCYIVNFSIHISFPTPSSIRSVRAGYHSICTFLCGWDPLHHACGGQCSPLQFHAVPCGPLRYLVLPDRSTYFVVSCLTYLHWQFLRLFA